uniref:Peptidase A2 domain-containing protein n=1 Tax=Parastrongyloides trichosuri TaxID=131310 RepID=A0A0N4Z1E8_PARTI
MRVGAELRGRAASFRRASKRSSSGRLSSLAVAFRASRFAAYFATRALTASLRFTALFLAIVLFPSRSVHERELELGEESLGFLIGLGRGADNDVHAPHLVDLVVVDLREHDVLLQTRGVVAATVERSALQAPEVLHARQRDGDQAVQELVHLVAAQRDLAADDHAFAQLEAGDGVTSLGRHSLLTGDGRQILEGRVGLLGVGDSFTDTHVQDDLVQLGDLHLVGVAELFLQDAADAVLIFGLEARRVLGVGHQMTSPVDLAKRTF